jgi:hypothetical protein
MADHLKIDFEALAIDVHLIEGMQEQSYRLSPLITGWR